MSGYPTDPHPPTLAGLFMVFVTAAVFFIAAVVIWKAIGGQ